MAKEKEKREEELGREKEARLKAENAY